MPKRKRAPLPPLQPGEAVGQSGLPVRFRPPKRGTAPKARHAGGGTFRPGQVNFYACHHGDLTTTVKSDVGEVQYAWDPENEKDRELAYLNFQELIEQGAEIHVVNAKGETGRATYFDPAKGAFRVKGLGSDLREVTLVLASEVEVHVNERGAPGAPPPGV